MATRWAVVSGNWSDPATWDGGTLPGVSDVVYLNGKTITLDADVEVDVITLGADYSHTPSLAAGGTLVVSTIGIDVTRTLKCSEYQISNNSNQLKITAPSGTFVLDVGSWVSLAAPIGYVMQLTGSCTVDVRSVLGGSMSSRGFASVSSAGATLKCLGVVPSELSDTVALSAGSSVIVNGDVYGGSGSYAGIRVFGSSAPTIVEVFGDVVAGGAPAITVSDSLSDPTVIVWGDLVHGESGAVPIYSRKFLVKSGQGHTYTARDDSASPGNAVPLSNALAGTPDVADVRAGTTFGGGESLTGTLAVPPASSVASGVPVDATAGTAALNLADVAAVVGSQIAAAVGS